MDEINFHDDQKKQSIAPGERTDSLDMFDSEGKKKSFSRLMTRFAEKTSMQGVPYINNAKLKGAKAVWSLLLLASIGVMGYHLAYLGIQFFAWPKVTKVSLGFSNLQLPAVTVCNVNVIRNSKVHLASSRMQSFLAAVDPSGFNPGNGNQQTTSQPQTTSTQPLTVGKRRRKRYANSYSNLNFSSFDEYDDIGDLYDDKEFGGKNSVYEIEETFKHLYMDMDRETRIDIGHSLERMLISCSFNGRECDATHFTLFQNSKFGNCYTLDSKKFVTRKPGPESGVHYASHADNYFGIVTANNSLALVLYLDNNDYLPGITQGYGSRIAIHDPNTIPDPAVNGFFISTAYETEVALKYVNISRIGKPHGKCNDGVIFKKLYKKIYTRQSCLTMCQQTTIMSLCGCYSDYSEEAFIDTNLQNKKQCATRTELLCEAKIQNEFEIKERNCVCENPCNEISYVKTLSTRHWPTDSYSKVLVQGVCDLNLTEECGHLRKLTDQRSLSSNLLKLVIYYEDLNYEFVEEEPEIKNAQFLSDVGGAVGLWIGLSVLSIFEVVQLLCELCDYGVHKCCKARKRAKKKRRKQQKKEVEVRQPSPKQNDEEDKKLQPALKNYGETRYRKVYVYTYPYIVYTGRH